MRDCLVDEAELALFGNCDANFWRRHEVWHIGQQLPNGFARVGEDTQQTRGAIQGVVVAVEAFTEEHMTRHFASDRGVRFLHLVLDEGVPRLPHNRFAASALNRVGECLGALDVEYDRLACAGTSKNIASVENEDA